MKKETVGGHGFYSPLRYPGGKGKVAPYIKALLEENNLAGCTYAEPYAGGAAVALELLFHEYAHKIRINDLDPGIAAFWRVVLGNHEQLCSLISRAKLNILEWRRQREVSLRTDQDDLSLAFATFYMNRTNRSGILRGGVIGGKAQAGHWKLDARFNKPDLIARIERIASLSDRIAFTQLDALRFVKSYITRECFLYLDPPYFHKGRDLYTHFYGPNDHKGVAKLVSSLDCSWLVSYDDVPEISKLYAGFRSIRYSLSYSAQGRYRGGELMFFAPGLTIPDFTGSMRAIPIKQTA